MTSLSHNPVSLEEAEAARERIRAVCVRTPLIRIETDSRADIYVKLENLQPIGSFKLRGAASKLFSLAPADLSGGVWTASAGNMAQGVAWCARSLGLDFTAVIPDTAPEAKISAIQRLGGRIRKVPRDEYFAIYSTRELDGQTGLFVHAFSDPDVMAGNATIALEILEDLPTVKMVFVPYGGGGLSCGIASIMRAHSGAEVVAAEPETAAPLGASLQAGRPTAVPFEPTFIDGAGSPHVFPEMFVLAQQLLAGAISVSVEETASALRLLAERAHIVAEGAGALSLAAALKHPEDGPLVCIVSGGNVNPGTFAQILRGSLPPA